MSLFTRSLSRLALAALGLAVCVLPGVVAPRPAQAADAGVQFVAVGKPMTIAEAAKFLPKPADYPTCATTAAKHVNAAALTPNAGSATDVSVTATGLPTDSSTVTSALPYTFAVTATVKNNGTVATPAFSVYFYGGGTKGKETPIKSLAAGASVTLNFTASYTTAGFNEVFVIADSFCQVNDTDESNNVVGYTFGILTPGVDLAAYGTLLAVSKTLVGGGLRVGDSYTPLIGIANFGSKTPTADVTNKSSYYGNGTIAASILPPSGEVDFYAPGGTGTATTAKKAGKISYSLSINYKDDSSKDNSTKFTYVDDGTGTFYSGFAYPHGVDLGASVGYPCPAIAGQSLTFDYVIGNTGDAAATGGTAQVLIDGKAVGSPITVPAIAAGKGFDGKVTTTITKVGAHTVSLVVKPADKDYNAKNNTEKLKFFVVAP